MLFPKLLLTIPLLVAFARATPADDMRRSASQIDAVSDMLNNSLNNTAALARSTVLHFTNPPSQLMGNQQNTSSMIQSLTWQIGASIANLAQSNTSSSQPLQQSNSSSSPTYDVPYFNYVDSVLTLSEALIRRGQVTHGEANQPVYNALQGLYNVIQSYAFQLDNGGKISTTATIRTLTAGNSLVDAESIWARNTTATSTSQRKVKRGSDAEP